MHLTKIKTSHLHIQLIIISVFFGIGAAFLYYSYTTTHKIAILQQELKMTTLTKQTLEKKVTDLEGELTTLKNEDQYVINQKLEQEIKYINATYKKAVDVYEKLVDLKILSKKTENYEQAFAKTLTLLSQRNYATTSSDLVALDKQITDEIAKITPSSGPLFANVSINNTPPSSGYSRQRVSTPIGEFVVDIVSADLASTRVIVDTASDGDCRDNCPVLPLADYVARNGAFAGINGSYFCPASYPSCAGKTNSFDTLVMNKNKKYINSDNNVYSTIPAVIFQSGSVRYVGQSLEWGRDTSVDGVLANQPLLLSGGTITFGGSGDPKQGSKGSRSFVGSKGSIVYIGVVHNATVVEVAHVLKAMGLEGALNLDSGGSTALWAGSYKVGPGRNIPNAILFVRK